MSSQKPQPKAVTAADLSKSLHRSRILNAVLAVAVAFLGIVAIAQGTRAPVEAVSPAAPGPTATATPQVEGEAGSGNQTIPDLARRIEGDPMAMGAIDAPVVIVEYADFRCPFCGVFVRDTMPIIVEEYVNKGLVRYEFRDLPLFGEESVQAAVAVRAAGEQGMYWEYYNALFGAAPETGHAELPREKLIEFARTVGVPDIDKFTQDLDSEALVAKVAADQAEGQKLGITGVPFFVIGQEAISGAHPIDAFREAIDGQLAAAGQ